MKSILSFYAENEETFFFISLIEKITLISHYFAMFHMIIYSEHRNTTQS